MSSANEKCNRSFFVYGFPSFGSPSPPPSYISDSTRIGLCYRRTPRPLILHDPLLIHIDRMTSRLFLNLRSAGSRGATLPRPQPAGAIPLGNRGPTPPESTQDTSSQPLTAVNLDSVLFAVASGVDQSAPSDQEQNLSWDTAEMKPREERSNGGDVESQPQAG